jgi:hypothetical protein
MNVGCILFVEKHLNLLSPQTLRARIPLKLGVLDTTLYVIEFVGDLQQVGGFPRVLRFPPPIKLTATI